ncbi:amino acid synthesis family protein [Rhizobium sp. A37_96]
MPQPEIRKIVTFVEEAFIEGGKRSARPLKAVGVAAILKNPWLGQGFVEDLQPVIHAFSPILGSELVGRLISLMPAEQIEAYGKCSTVGVDGEIEHGSALIHTLRFGNIFREAAGGTTYLSFTNTRTGPGALLSMPMTHKTVTGTRSHFLTLTFQVADAPRHDEILIAIGAADNGRAHARIGDRFQDMKEMGIES